MKLILAICLFAIVSCAPKLSPSTPRAVIVPPQSAPVTVAPVTESVGRVAVAVKAVREEAAEGRKSADKALGSALRAKALSDQTNALLVDAHNETITRLEETILSQQRLERRTSELEKEREDLSTKVLELSDKVAAAQTELAQTRLSLVQANLTIADDAAVIQGLNKANEKLIASNADGKVYKRVAITAMIAIFLALIGLVYLKFLKPL